MVSQVSQVKAKVSTGESRWERELGEFFGELDHEQ